MIILYINKILCKKQDSSHIVAIAPYNFSNIQVLLYQPSLSFSIFLVHLYLFLSPHYLYQIAPSSGGHVVESNLQENAFWRGWLCVLCGGSFWVYIFLFLTPYIEIPPPLHLLIYGVSLMPDYCCDWDMHSKDNDISIIPDITIAID